MSTSTLSLSSVEDLSEEGEEGDEEGALEEDVAVARPPRSAAASAEVIVSGQAALDILDQVRAPPCHAATG